MADFCVFWGKVWCEARDVCSFKMAVEMARFGATGGASKALPERCKQKIRRLKNSGFQTVEKPLSLIKMGSQGRNPRTGRQPFVPLHRAVALCG